MNTQNLSFSQKQFRAYPDVAVLFNVSIALTITGILMMLVFYAFTLTQKIKENIEVKLYLRPDVSEAQRLHIEKKLADSPFILYEEGRPLLRFLSKEEAVKMMQEKTGEDFVNSIGENPLPDSYYIRIKENYYQAENIKQVRSTLDEIDGIEQIVIEEASIQEINKNVGVVAMVLCVFASLFFLASVFVIDSSVKLALFSQRFIIRSMQLVGATQDFIRKPFIEKSLWNGFLGGGIASVLVFVCMQLSSFWIEELNLLYDGVFFGGICVVLVVMGIFTCAVSTHKAVSKYLKMPLDELY